MTRKPSRAGETPPLLRNSHMIGLGSTLTVGMAVFTLGGLYIGNLLDRTTEGILAGVFLGLFFCGYEVWKSVRKMNREAGKKEPGK